MRTTQLAAVLFATGLALAAQAQSTFTSQGRLNENGSGPTGLYDFEFRLHSASSGGLQVGSLLSREDVGVTNGLFTVALDFGPSAFPGADRFLTIAVRPGASVAAHTVLLPRQAVTATPYAITAANFSGTVGSAQLTGSYSGTVSFDNPGNSFIGSGAGLTGLNAASLIAGTVPADRIGDASITGTKIQDGAVSNDDIAPLANIDPAKIGSGIVSGLEFDALDGLSSPIQGQLDQRLATTGGTMSGTISFSGTTPGLIFPAVDASASPMISMFASGVANADRMVLAHSLAFPTWGLQYSDALDKFNFLGSGTAVLTVDLGSKRVGIGTTTPTRAKLEINGASGSYAFGQRGILNSAGATSGANTGNDFNASLWASGNVWASAVFAFSDERIKRIEGRSDATHDLATLLSIEITDYTYIDSVAKSAGKQKKVIAQQVEKAYPQAVSRNTDVVPDIYEMAEVRNGWVKLATDLKKGERIRLIGKKKEGIHEVLEVTPDKFRTGFVADGDEVFVYGREVQDFRSVDYEAIAMLNVSATQELNRRLEMQAAELKARDGKIAALEQAVADLATLVKSLQPLSLTSR